MLIDVINSLQKLEPTLLLHPQEQQAALQQHQRFQVLVQYFLKYLFGHACDFS